MSSFLKKSFLMEMDFRFAMVKNKKKNEDCKVIIIKDGPYLVSGGLPLAKEIIFCDKEGIPIKWAKGDKYPAQKTYLLCRCGQSKKMPYCDKTHQSIHFDGTETASRKKFSELAKKISGPSLVLSDAQEFCASARFCDRGDGVWQLTKDSDNPKSRNIAIQEAVNCPAGRLVVKDKKTGKVIEPKFKPSIGLVEDIGQRVSGPIWLKGGVQVVSSDGKAYEIRNRVTLCRCGKSTNKPFCDATHVPAGFKDGDKALKK